MVHARRYQDLEKVALFAPLNGIDREVTWKISCKYPLFPFHLFPVPHRKRHGGDAPNRFQPFGLPGRRTDRLPDG